MAPKMRFLGRLSGPATDKQECAALFIVYERARPNGETPSDSRSRLHLSTKNGGKKVAACFFEEGAHHDIALRKQLLLLLLLLPTVYPKWSSSNKKRTLRRDPETK